MFYFPPPRHPPYPPLATDAAPAHAIALAHVLAIAPASPPPAQRSRPARAFKQQMEGVQKDVQLCKKM